MILALLMACAGEKDGEDELSGVAGTVSAERVGATTETVTATVETMQAFGVNTNGVVAVLLSPNADATCADAATYLEGPGDDWSPEVITGVGTCSVYVRANYDGGPLETGDATVATVSLNCAMGEGEWVHEERDEGDIGYYYEGAWWIGSPDGFELTIDGGDGEDFAVSLAMEQYNGSFTYDVEYPDPDPASGAVSGEATATWCADMGPALAR